MLNIPKAPEVLEIAMSTYFTVNPQVKKLEYEYESITHEIIREKIPPQYKYSPLITHEIIREKIPQIFLHDCQEHIEIKNSYNKQISFNNLNEEKVFNIHLTGKKKNYIRADSLKKYKVMSQKAKLDGNNMKNSISSTLNINILRQKSHDKNVISTNNNFELKNEKNNFDFYSTNNNYSNNNFNYFPTLENYQENIKSYSPIKHIYKESSDNSIVKNLDDNIKINSTTVLNFNTTNINNNEEPPSYNGIQLNEIEAAYENIKKDFVELKPLLQQNNKIRDQFFKNISVGNESKYIFFKNLYKLIQQEESISNPTSNKNHIPFDKTNPSQNKFFKNQMFKKVNSTNQTMHQTTGNTSNMNYASPMSINGKRKSRNYSFSYNPNNETSYFARTPDKNTKIIHNIPNPYINNHNPNYKNGSNANMKNISINIQNPYKMLEINYNTAKEKIILTSFPNIK